MTINSGDKIKCGRITATVDRVLACEYLGSRLDQYGEERPWWGFDVEFVDTTGQYRHWEQALDGGEVITVED